MGAVREHFKTVQGKVGGRLVLAASCPARAIYVIYGILQWYCLAQPAGTWICRISLVRSSIGHPYFRNMCDLAILLLSFDSTLHKN